MGVKGTTELRTVARQLDEAEESLPRSLKSGYSFEVRRLKRGIIGSLVSKGLVDSGELRNSWRQERVGDGEWRIHSLKEYSGYLEDGTKPHRITPNEKKALHFFPESTSPYPEEVVNEDGSVTVGGVSHPGNKAYNYVFDAQAKWAATSTKLIDKNFDEFWLSRGFRPTKGGGTPIFEPVSGFITE